MFDKKLNGRPAIIFIGIQPVCQPGATGQHGRTAELDSVEVTTVFFQLQFQVAVFENALVQYGEFISKQGRRKSVSPNLCIQQVDEIQTETVIVKRTVRFDQSFQLRLGQPVLCHRLERFGKNLESIRF